MNNKTISKLINVFNNNFYIIIFSILILLSFFNGIKNIGIWFDGTWYFIDFIRNDIYLDFSRFFPCFILHIPIFLLKILNCQTISYIGFLSLFLGTWFYIVNIILLIFIYFLFPKKEKDFFVFPLIAYLLAVIFANYCIISEQFMTIMFFWCILTILLFTDLKEISIFKQIVLVAFSVMLVLSYQYSFIFSLMLAALILYKIRYVYNELSAIRKTTLILTMFFLFLTVFSCIYYIIYPTMWDNLISKYIVHLIFVLKNCFYVYFFSISLFFLFIDYKNKIIKWFFVAIFFVVSFFFIINNTDLLSDLFPLRTLVPFPTAILSVILIVFYLVKKNINFFNYKIICLILLLVYTANTLIFANKINDVLNRTVDVMNRTSSSIVDFDYVLDNLKEEDKKIIYNMDYNIPRMIVLFQIINFNTVIIDKVIYNKKFSKEDEHNVVDKSIVSDFNKFGLKYSQKLLEDIEKI